MRAAVLGKPVAHSLSPALHRAAYRELGLTDWSYETVECDEAGLERFIATRDEQWAGLSLTMPLKRAVLPLLDHADPLATATGSANTVVFRADGRHGYNTDVQGITSALTEAGADRAGSVLILGAGATACSALAAVGGLGAPGADVAVRDPARAASLLAAAGRLGVRVRLRDLGAVAGERPDLLVSTVPPGAADFYAERIDATAAAPAAVLDVVYAPWPTPLAMAAARAGALVVGGFAMLLHQAAAQLELITGRSAPLETMRVAGQAEIARRSAAG